MSESREMGPRPRVTVPIGVCILTFFLVGCAGIGTVLAMLWHEARSRATGIESETRLCAVHLAESLSGMAELSHRTGGYGRLREVFHAYAARGAIGEAMFVRKDGSIVAHSNPAAEREVKGNIANDEFAYNIDLILQPVRQNSRDVLFTDYHIVSKRVPYPPYAIQFLKRYVYRSIDSTGWMAAKAVFRDKKAVGAVCFIIPKDRIYATVDSMIVRARNLAAVVAGAAFGIALAVSLVVFARYRVVYKRALAARVASQSPPSDEPIAVSLIDVTLPETTTLSSSRPVKDAVPVRKE